MNAHTPITATDNLTAESLALEIAEDIFCVANLAKAIDIFQGANLDTSEAENLLRGQLEDTSKIANRLHEMLRVAK